jgi:leucyl/phenylalanyl-tRNA---protein transferase
MPRILDSKITFPDPRTANAEGLVAIGGDLSVPRLLLAYSKGIFPWTVHPITWWSPDPRAIIELNEFRPPRSLEKRMRKRPFAMTTDRAFLRVMAECAAPAPGRDSTWISPEFIDAYTRLHEQDHAHSVECWRDSELVGGIYGVSVGGFFAGESMFHRVDDASKAALSFLIDHLRARGFELFDIQTVTPATRRLGAAEIPRDDYLKRLKAAIGKRCSFE